VLSDSGGIQEEAPSFGKHCIVMREVTERMESVNLGMSELVVRMLRRSLVQFSAQLKEISSMILARILMATVMQQKKFWTY